MTPVLVLVIFYFKSVQKSKSVQICSLEPRVQGSTSLECQPSLAFYKDTVEDAAFSVI